MKKIRTLLALVTVVLLMGGYLSSQFVRISGGSADRYTAALDQSSIPILSLFLLVAAVVLAFIPTHEEDAS